ncbi:MAG: toll/interleukin-1 receptor domain-containing protein [Ruminococcaceae bacterium]|nr:toll/interleukin-1 receptor domain-containing protein [Oscillospiraceae bacterium]
MNKDVFISYSSKDQKIADNLVSVIESKGASCWIAHRDIIPGEEWAESINNAIQNCRIFVLIFSKDSNSSVQVGKEINLAVSNNKVIIPYKIDSTEIEGGMKYYLCDTHWFDANNRSSGTESCEELATLITSILKPEKPDPIPEPIPDPVPDPVADSEPVPDPVPRPTDSKKKKVNKKSKTKLIVTICVSFLALVLIAVGIALYFIDEYTYRPGTYYFDRYESDYFNIGFNLPDDWEFIPDDELSWFEDSELIDVSDELIYEIAGDSNKSLVDEISPVTVMAAENTEDYYGRVSVIRLDFLNTEYENREKAGLSFGEIHLLDYLQDEFYDIKYKNISIEIGNKKFDATMCSDDGEECICIFYIIKGTMVEVVIIDGYDEDQIMDTIDCFYIP